MIVAIRGVDGSGKSTVAAMVAGQLHDQQIGARVVKIALVANPAFMRYRDVLTEGPQPMQRLLRGALATAETLHVAREEIVPSDQRGEVVVCDRYWRDTAAYLELRSLATRDICRALEALPEADLEFILDLPLELAEERCRRLGERWSPGFHRLAERTHARLLLELSRGNVHRLDAEEPPELICSQVVGLIKEAMAIRAAS